MKVGYILKMFPRLSETFILNEILELEAQGFDVEIFSLHPPADSRFHGQLSLLRGSVSYVANAESWGRISHSVQRQPHLLNLEPEAKIRRIYNGVPVEKISVSSQAFTDAQLILAVGRLIEKKGFNYLIEACRYLRDRNRKFVCMIIGTGDQEDELRRLIGRLDLSDTVQLVGPQSQGAVAEAIARSSMMVLPCVVAKDGDRDALPTVLLEAMAAGRPVVSTTLEGVDEIVDSGRTGFLVPQRDSLGLAQAIDRLIIDPALRAGMGLAARRKAEKIFSLTENVAQLARLFGVAAATKGEPARELLPMAFR